jgi:hypothetical protein
MVGSSGGGTNSISNFGHHNINEGAVYCTVHDSSGIDDLSGKSSHEILYLWWHKREDAINDCLFSKVLVYNKKCVLILSVLQYWMYESYLVLVSIQ